MKGESSSTGRCAQVEYPEIDDGEKPRHRFMSAYEQKKEAWDKTYQYLLFAAEPYEVVAFKVPNMEVDRTDRFFSHWSVLTLALPYSPARVHFTYSVAINALLSQQVNSRTNSDSSTSALT